MRTLRRYVLGELLFPFVMGVVVFTALLIMDRMFTLSDLIVKYGVSVFAVVKLVLYILPSTFAITIPMACLVAVIVAFSRLKADNEITAMKASGISLMPLIAVVALAGLAVTLGLVVFNNTLLPRANTAYLNVYFNIVSQRAAIVVQDHVFVEDFDGYSFRVREKNPLTGDLKDVVVLVHDRDPFKPPKIILAKRGRLISDETNRRVVLKLEDGVMQISSSKDRQDFSLIRFAENYLDLDINRELAKQDWKNNRSAREMSMDEILAQIRVQQAAGENVNLLWVEYHKKISIPFACLVFVLVGAPLGVLSPRSGRYFAYFIGVVMIFAYYILISLGETFGADGRIGPFLAMWLPNLLLLAAGVYGLLWVAWERPPFLPGWNHRAAGRS